jgi:protein-S-isoprenylcysteine O-methyltransferase Ste14
MGRRPKYRLAICYVRRLIAMALGTAIDYGRAFGFVLFVALCGSLWWKARQEERIMSKHFPDAYAEYKTRVRAIVPWRRAALSSRR